MLKNTKSITKQENVVWVIKKALTVIGIFSILPVFALAEFKLSEYKYYKNIVSGEAVKGSFSFVIDDEIYKDGNQFFSDLRVVDKDNKEVPYTIEKKFDQIDTKTYDKDLDIIFQKKNTFVLDMGETPVYHQSIDVVTNSFDFSRVVDIYGSNLTDSRFEKLTLSKQGDLVAVVPGNNDTNINFKYTNYRYIKLVFSGNEGVFIPERFTFKKTDTKKVIGSKEIFALKKEDIKSTNPKEQKFILESVGENTPVDSIVLHSTEKDFSRTITIYTSNNKDAQLLINNNRYNKETSYWKKVYSGNFSEQVYSDEQIFNIKDNKKYYLVIINNQDNAALDITGATATRFLDTVYIKNLDFINNSYKVFYGNIFAKKPKYDVGSILKDVSDIKNSNIELSKQESNILYVAPKEKLGEEKPYLIYVFIAMLVIILFWFVYKIMRETGNKDRGEKIDVIDKL